MDNFNLSEQEILRRLKTDPKFTVTFAVTNNSSKVIDNLREMGYEVGTPREAINVLDNLINQRNMGMVRRAISVPYDEGAQNWTRERGHLIKQASVGYQKGDMIAEQDVMVSPEVATYQEPKQDSNIVGNILSTVGAVATSLGGIISGSGTSSKLTPEQLAVMKKEQEEQERIQKRNTYIVIGVVGFLLLVAIYFIFVKGNKKSK